MTLDLDRLQTAAQKMQPGKRTHHSGHFNAGWDVNAIRAGMEVVFSCSGRAFGSSFPAPDELTGLLAFDRETCLELVARARRLAELEPSPG